MNIDTVNPEVTEVGVVFKTHLDIGFTDFANSVVNRYMTDYIPASLELAKKTRELPHRFVWTTGSWLAYHYLENANASGRKRMEEAIIAGDFYWHALPFTSHCELMSPSLFRLGLQYSKLLDQRFGRTTRGAKVTDVPGHTIGIVPLLAEAGIQYLHIGLNPASAVAELPSNFIWRRGDHEIVVSYDGNYGGVTMLPEKRALSVNLTGDNLGPQNPGEIGKVYKELQRRFPNARIIPGGMDVMVPHIWEQRHEFPVVTSEVGDTWIHGVGTDPMKTAQFHELSRLREQWIAQGELEAAGPDDLKFGEQLLLVAEHTWGMDLKTHLRDWRRYGPRAFENARGESNFLKLEKSWQEQRNYIASAIDALPFELQSSAKPSLSALAPKLKQSTDAWRLIDCAAPFQLGDFEISLDPATGGMVQLNRRGEARNYASYDQPLGVLSHQTFSPADYDRYYDQYIRGKADWNWRDFAKPGLSSVAKSATHIPTLTSLELSADNQRARLGLMLPKASIRSLGAASLCLELEAASDGIQIRLEICDKPACRMPEAYWFSFHPQLEAGVRWEFKKLGEWIDPADVVRRGNRYLHAVDQELRAGDVHLTTLDAVLVAPERGHLLEFSQQLARVDAGISVNLYNNIWGTNFPMWYEDDSTFRFKITV
jgi:hypothetical protein